MGGDLARVFERAEKLAEKAGDSFVTAERLLLALVIGAPGASGAPGAGALGAAGSPSGGAADKGSRRAAWHAPRCTRMTPRY